MKAERDRAWVLICEAVKRALSFQTAPSGVQRSSEIQPGVQLPEESSNQWGQSPLHFSVETIPVQVRSEGMTELVGDILIACTCVEPLAAPATHWFSVRVQFYTNITSRLSKDGNGMMTGEALLFEAGNQGRNDILRPRIEANVAVFPRIELNGIRRGETRTFQISNLRCNAAALGGDVIVRVIVSGDPFPGKTIAMVESGLTGQLRPVEGLNKLGAFKASQSVSLPISRIANLRFCEGFPFAFKSVFPMSQKEPALLDGFKISTGESYAPRQALPSHGQNRMGLADHGTQLAAQFHNVPTGVRLFVTVAERLSSLIPARLVQSQSRLKGTVLLVDNVELCELEIVNGSARAVWEVSGEGRSGAAYSEFGVFASYFGNPKQNSPPIGTATVNPSFWPCPPTPFSTSAGGVASSTLPIPRFADTSSAINLMTIAL